MPPSKNSEAMANSRWVKVVNRTSTIKAFFRITMMLILIGSSLFSICEAAPKRINIFIRAVAGGYGDVASNVIMAKHLKELYPGLEITFITHPASEGPLYELLHGYPGQGFTSKNPLAEARVFNLKKIERMSYSDLEKLNLKADFNMGFAGLEIPRELHLQAPYSFYVNEYQLPDLSKTAKQPRPINSRYWKTNGGPGLTGMYLSAGQATPPLSREQLYQVLLSREPSLPPLDQCQMGFTYTSTIETESVYLDAMILKANKNQKSKALVLMCKDCKPDLPLPANVKLVSLKGAPLDVHESGIAHSDLPVMTTGDVSATFAVEYEKPFFYETNYWKEDFSQALNKQLRVNLKRGKHQQYLGAALRVEAKEPTISAAELERLASNPKFLDAYQRAIHEGKKSINMTRRLKNLFEFLEEFKVSELESSDQKKIYEDLFYTDQPHQERMASIDRQLLQGSQTEQEFAVRLLEVKVAPLHLDQEQFNIILHQFLDSGNPAADRLLKRLFNESPQLGKILTKNIPVTSFRRIKERFNLSGAQTAGCQGHLKKILRDLNHF